MKPNINIIGSKLREYEFVIQKVKERKYRTNYQGKSLEYRKYFNTSKASVEKSALDLWHYCEWKGKSQPKKSETLFSNNNNQLQLDITNTIPITVNNVNNEVSKQHDTVVTNYSQITEFMKEYSQILKREDKNLGIFYETNA